MGRKLIIIFKIREKQEEQGVGGELRGAGSLGRNADTVQKRNLELCSAKWDLCRNFP